MEKKRSEEVEEYRGEREKYSRIVFSWDKSNMKRFLGLVNAVCRDGPLDAKTDELLSPVAPPVVRRGDCIAYRVIQPKDCFATDTEFDEVIVTISVPSG